MSIIFILIGCILTRSLLVWHLRDMYRVKKINTGDMVAQKPEAWHPLITVIFLAIYWMSGIYFIN